MVVVDTSVWIDFFGGIVTPETSLLRRVSGLAITDLILCEVLQGIRHNSEFARVKSRLLTLNVFDSGGSALALAAAENCRLLRATGYTTRTTIDLLIATFCIEFDHELAPRSRLQSVRRAFAASRFASLRRRTRNAERPNSPAIPGVSPIRLPAILFLSGIQEVR